MSAQRGVLDGAESAARYVLADCAETGVTVCFAKVSPRAERFKDPYRRRKYTVHWYPRHSLGAAYSGERSFSALLTSPFWMNPRLVALDQIPKGVTTP